MVHAYGIEWCKSKFRRNERYCSNGMYSVAKKKYKAYHTQDIGRAYGTGPMGYRLPYPGVKTSGLQFMPTALEGAEASSGGTNDIVAMEFIPLP